MAKAEMPAADYTGSDFIRDRIVPLWNSINMEAMKHLEYQFLLTSIFGEEKRIGLRVYTDREADEYTFHINGGEVTGFEESLHDPRVMVTGKPYVKLFGEPITMKAIYELHAESLEGMVQQAEQMIEEPFQAIKQLFPEVELRLGGIPEQE